jgi:hypothetical protein
MKTEEYLVRNVTVISEVKIGLTILGLITRKFLFGIVSSGLEEATRFSYREE